MLLLLRGGPALHQFPLLCTVDPHHPEQFDLSSYIETLVMLVFCLRDLHFELPIHCVFHSKAGWPAVAKGDAALESTRWWNSW